MNPPALWLLMIMTTGQTPTVTTQPFYDHFTCKLAEHWITSEPVRQANGGRVTIAVCTPARKDTPDDYPEIR